MNNKVKIYAILWDIFIGHSCECMNQKCIRFCCILNPYCTHQAWCMKAEKSLSKDREAKKKLQKTAHMVFPFCDIQNALLRKRVLWRAVGN